MRITIVYDNEVYTAGLRSGWGFAAMVEEEGEAPILFDTGADSATLLHNMKSLDIHPGRIGVIVISHAHADHMGGLRGVLEVNATAELYLPQSPLGERGRSVTVVGRHPIEIRNGVFSTGVLDGIEQALALRTEGGVFVLTGCSHPDMRKILGAAARFGKPRGIAGGFHGFHDFKAFDELETIYPCHCTMFRQELAQLFKDRVYQCGVGRVIDL